MSRKQIREESWATVKQWTLTHGYSPYKASSDNRTPHGTVVIVHHEKFSDESSHPLLRYAASLSPLLNEAPSPSPSPHPAPPLILVLDLTRLDVSNQLDSENSKLEYIKSGIGKATVRALEKLGLSNATVVCTGKACSLLMKLFRPSSLTMRETGWTSGRCASLNRPLDSNFLRACFAPSGAATLASS